nr:recombinase family protein [Solidesulfovibrio alcoholivorans]
MSHGQHVGYARVSSLDQKTDRQLDGIQLDRMFEEKASGKDTKRPVLADCLAYVRQGDTLHVHSIDRLCRNLSDLLRIVTALREKGVCVRFHKENLSFGCGESDATSELMLGMLGAVAQFERALIKERQREGIAAAKRAGKHLGRKQKLTDEQFNEIVTRVKSGEDKTSIAKAYGISRATVYNFIKRKNINP